MSTPDVPFSFEITHTKGRARAGVMQTPHGPVETPIFMPVGTLASVKSLDQQDILSTQAEIILANTYHLYLRPGTETLQQFGGVHEFMGWNRPILTDSGGFQVLSLGTQAASKLARVGEEGVTFRSHIDGSKHHFSPTTSIEIQQAIGADIIMAFDEAMSDGLAYKKARASIDRTTRWAAESVDAWEARNRLSAYGKYQALFGIIQGGMDESLRTASAAAIAALPFDGIALGGETIGYNQAGTPQVLDWLQPALQAEERPVYAMGLGRDPIDLLTVVTRGVDMFDCVGPTRLARNGSLYSGELQEKKGGKEDVAFISEFPQGRIRIGSATFTHDKRVLDENCDCHTCSHGYSRAYLHHLYKTRELSYYRLASIHNVRFMVRLSKQLREWICR